VQTDSAIKELIMEAHAHLAEIKILEKRIARDRIDISEKRSNQLAEKIIVVVSAIINLYYHLL
jgi:hypothetical protein